MIDRTLLRENPELVRRSLVRRGLDATPVDEACALDERWRAAVTRADRLKAERNALSAAFAQAKASGTPDDLDRLRRRSNELAAEVAAAEHEAREAELALVQVLEQIPNLVADEVPDGSGEEANVQVRSSGPPPAPAGTPKPHWDIGEELGILDFERGARLARSRFAVLVGAGARLSRALVDFFLARNLAAGFTEINPPILVNRESVAATGHLSKFSDQMFSVDGASLYLSPTAEVQLVNLHRDEILAASDLPKLYTAYTPCFRQEAGAAGKDTRGLIRQHQFEKVELVAVCEPSQAAELHERITAQAESLLQALGLPYRVMALCAGDLGFASRKTYDLEAWLPGQNAYREISSCSDCGDFQARRANLRFRSTPTARPRFAHTLNGSALAVGRTLVAILENYRQPDGSVVIPEVLRPYMQGLDAIRPA
jgi:seryl-tRNA synthetase